MTSDSDDIDTTDLSSFELSLSEDSDGNTKKSKTSKPKKRPSTTNGVKKSAATNSVKKSSTGILPGETNPNYIRKRFFFYVFHLFIVPENPDVLLLWNKFLNGLSCVVITFCWKLLVFVYFSETEVTFSPKTLKFKCISFYLDIALAKCKCKKQFQFCSENTHVLISVISGLLQGKDQLHPGQRRGFGLRSLVGNGFEEQDQEAEGLDHKSQERRRSGKLV
jgi:hypothetical protein